MFQIDGLVASEVCALGAVARSGALKFYGWAELNIVSVQLVGLRALRDDKPHRHVTVDGWPTDGKESVKMRAIELAAVSQFTAC